MRYCGSYVRDEREIRTDFVSHISRFHKGTYRKKKAKFSFSLFFSLYTTHATPYRKSIKKGEREDLLNRRGMAFLFDRAPKRGCCELRISFSDGVWLLKEKSRRNAKRSVFCRTCLITRICLFCRTWTWRDSNEMREGEIVVRRLSEFQEEAFYRSYAWAVPPDI